MSNENTHDKSDEASAWYNQRNIENLRQVESQLNDLAAYHSQLESSYDALDKRQKEATAVIDMDTALEIERQRARMENEANQVVERYGALQAQKQHLETNPDPRFDELMAATKDNTGQLFLTVHRAKLQDAAAVKNLMYAHSRAASYGIRPGTNAYYKALEASMGWDESDRSADALLGESDEMRQTKNATKRETKDKPESHATEAQRAMAASLEAHSSGKLTADEYLNAVANPFSAAQTVSLEPDDLNFSQSGKPLEVSLDETPKQEPVRYKAPNPKTSVNLSPAELSLIENMAVTTGRPVKEVRLEFAKQKRALHAGETSHMLYQDRLKAMGQA